MGKREAGWSKKMRMSGFALMASLALLPGCRTIEDVSNSLRQTLSQGDQSESGLIPGISKIAGVTVGVGCARSVESRAAAQLLCGIAGLAAKQFVNAVGEDIAAEIAEEEQREVLVATNDALKSGEPRVLKLPKSNGTLKITPKQSKQRREVQVAILVNASNVNSLGDRYVVAGSAFPARTRVNVRSGPGTNFGVVGSLDAGSLVHVFGETESKEWLLVGFSVNGDWGPEPMATGFVSAQFINRAASAGDDAEADLLGGGQMPSQAELTEVTWLLECDDTDFDYQKEGATEVVKETSTMCVGPTGESISA